MLRDNKYQGRDKSLHRDEGRTRYPDSEWGESTEFGHNSEFRPPRESDSFRKSNERPFDMDNYYSGQQFSVGGRDFDQEDEQYWMSTRKGDGREYNRSRFAEPYTGGQFARSQYGLGGDFGGRQRSYDEGLRDRGFSGKGPKGYRRSDDRIREEVCEALFRSPFVDASDIEVTVKDGCVSLKGTVDSRNAKREAESCIENLSGVDDIQNELRLRRAQDTENSGATRKSSDLKDEKRTTRGH